MTDESEFNPRDVARELLRRVLYDPVAIATLVAHGLGLKDVEAKFAERLEYLEG